MVQRGRPKAKPTRQRRDDFQRITGIGPAVTERLHDAGVLTYEDLAARNPEELAALLVGAPRVSSERIASQDWSGQARQLATTVLEPSDPGQHYASFNIEFLLESDNSVRRTKIHDHQAETDAEADVGWPGWDEDRLLIFFHDRIPLLTAPEPTAAATDLQLAPIPSLPPSFLRIDELTPIRDDHTGFIRHPDEPTSVRLTLRISPTDSAQPATVDYTADIAARKLGGHERVLIGGTHGALRATEPLSVEVTGPTLSPGLYRLVVTLALYPRDHTSEAQLLFSQSASGEVMQVADEPLHAEQPRI